MTNTTPALDDGHLSDGDDTWTAYAERCERIAEIEEARGDIASGQVWRRKAETARRTIQAQKLEADTGIAHCVCCLKPRTVPCRRG